jgi:hypothetical protein
MTRGDLLVERGADRLQELSRKAASRGGFAAKLADELAEDAAFLRQLKPSLIKARAKGQAPADRQVPISRAPDPEPTAPSAPENTPPPAPRRKLRRRAKKASTDSGRRRKGPNPFLVAGIALATGIAVAKVIDWRSHAHPRD